MHHEGNGMKNYKKLFLPLSVALAMIGCSEDPLKHVSNAVDTSAKIPIVKFNPSEGAAGLPFPTDILFSNTPDGSLNIPEVANSATVKTTPSVVTAPLASDFASSSGPQIALNTMDGYSTTAPIIFTLLHPADSNVDRSAFSAATGIRVFEASATTPQRFVSTVGRELINGIDFVISGSPNSQGTETTVAIVPIKPLQSSTTYLVMVTSDLITKNPNQPGFTRDIVYNALHNPTTPIVEVTAAGFPSGTSCANAIAIGAFPAASAATACAIRFSLISDLSTALSLDGLRLSVRANEIAAVAFDSAITFDSIALTFSFTTQNIGGALAAARATILASPRAPTIVIDNPSNAVSPDIINSPLSGARIFVGSLNNTVQFTDPANLNSSVWKGSATSWAAAPLPAAAIALCLRAFPNTTSSENLVACNGFTPAATGLGSIPVVITTPQPSACSSTVDVLIYQHGITTNRGTIALIADAMAQGCVATIGIDLPKHGLVVGPTADQMIASLIAAPTASENIAIIFAKIRDLTTTAEILVPSSVPGGCQGTPIGTSCPSGDNFINLANLANSRDTIRQGAINLHSLYRALTTGTALADLSPQLAGYTLDKNNVHFLGMSLGAITGMPFVAQEPGIKTVSLNVGSGGIAKLLDSSASFEPIVTAGLAAAAGITKPSSSYESFLIAAQTLLDSTDPINFSTTIGAPQGTATAWQIPATAVIPGTARPVLFQEVIGTSTSAGTWTCNPSGNNNTAEVSGCPDLTVPNNALINTGTGSLLGNIESTDQINGLPGQNPVTMGIVLSGTDILTRGSTFIPESKPPINAITNAAIRREKAIAAGAFTGMNLSEVSGIGTRGTVLQTLVRYVQGGHGSLLNPAINNNVTTAMQTQVVTFVVQNGAIVAGTGTATLSQAQAATIRTTP